MQIQPTQPINFGYSHELKTLYKKGKIPLKFGFYGDALTPSNVSLEHILCVSEGGLTELDNIVLCSSRKNVKRGNRPLSEVINLKAMVEYFDVFKNKVYGSINGNDYIDKCMATIQKVLKEGK